MATDRHALGGVGGRQASAHREAAAHAFGDAHDVWRDAGVLMREQLAGAPDAGLDFVEDQQQLVLVAERPQAAQESGGNDAHAALALDRLDHDGPGGGRDGALRGFEVGDGDLVEAFDLGAEALDIFGLAAGGERRQRAAMEGAFEG